MRQVSNTGPVSLFSQATDKPIACALKCWENSKYVSNCHHEMQCLCEDAEFQIVRLLRSAAFASNGLLTVDGRAYCNASTRNAKRPNSVQPFTMLCPNARTTPP